MELCVKQFKNDSSPKAFEEKLGMSDNQVSSTWSQVVIAGKYRGL